MNGIARLSTASILAFSGCATAQTSAKTAVASKPPPSHNDISSPSPLISLAESTAPFRDAFNASADRPRFVAILSSTCGPCVSGAVTVEETIVKGFRDAGIDINVVWIDVLPSDGLPSARRASRLFSDPRVRQFHDPNQLLGDAFAKGLVSRGPAWDIYLFYPAGVRWEDAPPAPIDWMHQLGGGVADESRYMTEVRLATAMHDAMTSLGLRGERSAPTGEELASARSAATARIGAAACETAIDAAGQCERCAAAGSIGQCSISGWRYVVASRVRDGRGDLTNRFEMTGAPRGPIALGEVDESDARYEYSIEGMTCPDCTIAVAGKLRRGVTRVEVDYDGKRLIVYTNGDPASKLDMLPMHLGLAGYEVVQIE